MSARRGRLYGVGTGPGDPELMTLRACRIIRENEVIAVPGKDPKSSVAYGIAVKAVPELAGKELLTIDMPMTKDREALRTSHAEAAAVIEEILDAGRNVVYLTLGDPSIYSSFSYIKHIVEADGYETKMVSGVTSFSTAASALNVSLAEWDEPLHIVPAFHSAEEGLLNYPGNFVLMKSAGKIREVKDLLSDSGLEVMAAENCGMEGEKVYGSIDEIPGDAGYFTLVIAKRDPEE